MIDRSRTKKILGVAIVVFVILIILGYTFFASRDYINGPEIVIISPEDGSTIATSTVFIKGIAKRIQNISLNGRPVLIDEHGNFEETILLNKGYNAFLFEAEDRFDRKTDYKLELIYKP